MFDIEAEKCLLFCCLTDKKAFSQARDIVGWNDFVKPEHKTIFKCLEAAKIDDWNIISTGRAIKEMGFGKVVGGSAYLLELANSHYSTANVIFWSKVVRKGALERQKEELYQNRTTLSDSDFISKLTKIADEIKRLDSKQDSIALRVCERVEANINNATQTIKTDWHRIDTLSMHTLAGTICLFCGNVGAAKSFMTLQFCRSLMRQNIKFAILELEETSDFHILRALAQHRSMAGLTDPEWCKENPDAAREAYQDTDFVNAIGAAMEDAPEVLPTLDQCALWVERKATEGCRVVIVDPISLAKRKTDRTWKEDEELVDSVKKTALRHNITVILVTHPVKQCSFPDVSQLSGGVVYSRACQTVLWLQHHEPITSEILTPCGTDQADHTRTMHILKARNGAGQGKKIAMELNKETLTLSEIGVIVKKAKK